MKMQSIGRGLRKEKSSVRVYDAQVVLKFLKRHATTRNKNTYNYDYMTKGD